MSFLTVKENLLNFHKEKRLSGGKGRDRRVPHCTELLLRQVRKKKDVK